MKFEVYINNSRKPTEVECEGTGSKDAPLIIKNIEFPKGLEINKSNKFVIFENCAVEKFSLLLKKSQNLTIKGGKYNNIFVGGCSNILVKDALIIKQLSFQSCQTTTIEGCLISRLQVYRSTNHVIKNCTIKHITKRAY